MYRLEILLTSVSLIAATLIQTCSAHRQYFVLRVQTIERLDEKTNDVIFYKDQVELGSPEEGSDTTFRLRKVENPEADPFNDQSGNQGIISVYEKDGPVLIDTQPSPETINRFCPQKPAAKFLPHNVWTTDWRIGKNTWSNGYLTDPSEYVSYLAAEKQRSDLPMIRTLASRLSTYALGRLKLDSNTKDNGILRAIEIPDDVEVMGFKEKVGDNSGLMGEGRLFIETPEGRAETMFFETLEGEYADMAKLAHNPPDKSWMNGALDMWRDSDARQFAACQKISSDDKRWYLFKRTEKMLQTPDKYYTCYWIVLEVETVTDDDICYSYPDEIPPDLEPESKNKLLFQLYHSSVMPHWVDHTWPVPDAPAENNQETHADEQAVGQQDQAVTPEFKKMEVEGDSEGNVNGQTK